MFCQTCPKKDFCTTLCPEAEAYSRQDHETRREHFSFPQVNYTSLPEDPHDPPEVTKTERKIVMLHKKGFSRPEICFLLNLSRPALAVKVSRIRSKCKGFRPF